MKCVKHILLLILFWSVCQCAVAQQYRKLLKRLDSAGIHLYAGVDTKALKQQIKRNPQVWQKAINLLTDKAKLNNMIPGRYPVDGDNAYAKISVGPAKSAEQVQWESHRRYIDLQYIVSGTEQMEVAVINSLTITQTYNAADDVAHYSGKGKLYMATPAKLFLFFPDDAHKPDLKVANAATVKKLVIKIAYKE